MSALHYRWKRGAKTACGKGGRMNRDSTPDLEWVTCRPCLRALGQDPRRRLAKAKRP